ncbi:fiber [Synechococcus phage S-SSM7]|uniref:Fiber n=1 Tax=Synechococcus phage S-SSM7 TaxID=445686 RepID=E3SKU6_9CAUD|nr:tail fiber protein [Synechococcus phage S-SSM7]ADO98094.1 fiber [Synechococcus phage S-SSM7]
MPLSRLENFLKNAEGNILYVNPSDFDATDSIENRGNSQTRPFKTIQRALIEAARFSYQTGKNNDKIDRTTILAYPGTHYIDNRPGFTVVNNGGNAEFKQRKNAGYEVTSLEQFTTESNFDVLDPNNELYKYNSTEGGAIMPRGTSIIGLDLRKTKLRPLYVPDPQNDDMEYGGVLRVTGTCYFTAFTIFDADITKTAYYDYDSNRKTPSYSHHKLATFTYADGINNVLIDGTDSGLTDLDMYYFKVAKAYGDSSGRPVGDYPTFDDFEPNVDEFRIVGDLQSDPVGVTSIRAGDGNTPTATLTINTNKPHGLFKDTPVLIAGITTAINSYNGSFLVDEVTSNTQFTVQTPNVPANALPTPQEIQNSSVIVESDTVGSASPYIFNVSLRSVFGMNGLDCDGDKATGFKSMVCAQFTGISIQKDDNAFILYNPTTAIFNDTTTVAESDKPLHSNSRAIYKPFYETSHMRTRNNSVIQLVSVFAIAYARHFHAERGGDASITNSNSNFGQTALEATGFRPTSFDRDDVGYITHVIPPREIVREDSTVSWLTIDTRKTIGVGVTERMYLFGYNNEEIIPPAEIDSFKVGARNDDKLFLSLVNTLSGQAVQETYESPIFMQVPSGIGTSGFKEYEVIRNSGVNAIISNVFQFKTTHQLVNGEKVRVFSNTGETPSGIINDKIYFAISGGTLAADRIQLASTFNDAIARRPITGISNGGGKLVIRSTVSDKNPGDPGHPMQFDETTYTINNVPNTVGGWYLTGASNLSNTIYPALVSIGVGVIGEETGTTFLKRRVDNRSLLDRLYRLRYVIPKEHINARAPKPGFILQESKTVGVGSASFLSADLSNPTQLKNVKIIKTASWNAQTISYTTEEPHRLQKGDIVTIRNIDSVNNSTGTFKLGYNGEFGVDNIISTKKFTVTGISTDPGLFLNQVNQRTTQQQIEALPTVQRSKALDSFTVYRVQENKPHVPGTSGQDGVYNITMVCASIPLDKDLGFGVSTKSFQQDVRNLYPQQDRDNYDSDPEPTITHASAAVIGEVITNNKKKSITKESLGYFMQGQQVGFAATGAVITGTGNTTVTLFTDVEHNFNSIKGISIVNPGAGYNNGSGIATVIYAGDLENSALIGRNASAKITISAAGTITDAQLLDGGCGYGIGNTMTVSSFPAGAPSVAGVVSVTSIFNNVGDGLNLSGFEDPKLNGTFKIVDIPTSKSVSVEISTSRNLDPYFKERDDRRVPTYHLANIGVGVTYIDVSRETGLTTVRTDNNHSLVPGNGFVIQGTGNPLFDDRKLVVDGVEEGLPLRSITFNVGIITSGIDTSYSVQSNRLFGTGISANGKSLSAGENNLAGRSSYFYTGISTTINAPLTSTDTTITLSSTEGFKRGDYCMINGEIVRFTSDNINNILRGQFGTLASPAITGTTIKKIKVLAMELRRPSILRASGHTFEYLGYGSGNYSTSLPQKQDRVLSDQETLSAQKKELDGGTVVYTGMNDSGDFFTGYKKLSSITGEEEVLEAPVFTYVGDDAEAETIKRASGVFDEVLIRESLTVEGGDNNNRTSQFYGPVNMTEKLTNTSEDGIETVNLSLRGDAPQGKVFTVGISTPLTAARSGDISFVGVPNAGGYLGHIFAEGEWRRFGAVSQERDRSFYKFDQIGIGQSGVGIFNFKDSLEVNGVAKIKDLFVSGIVTFAANQSFAGVSYDTLVIKKNANFWGYNTTGGISYDGIPWEQHGYYTQVHEAGTSRLYNMEVVGTYVTFKPASAIHVEGPMKSTFAGVSTFSGTLKVGNLESTGGTFNGTFVNADNASFQVLEASTQLYARAGIVTDLHVTVGVVTNGLYADIGITTLSHVGTQYVNENRVFTGIVTNLQVTNSATIANETVTNATITNLIIPNTGSADIEVANIDQITATDITFTDDLIGPDAYFSNDVDSDGLTTRYIGSKYGPNPGVESEQLTIFANAGLYTCISGFAMTMARINMTSGGDGLAAPKVTADVGIITALSAGSNANMTIDAGPAGQIKSFQFESIATNVPPIKTSSSVKCVNLNADLLDGLTMIDNNWTSGASIVGRDSNGSTKVNVITANQFAGGSGAFPNGITGNNANIGGNNTINNLTVTGSFDTSGGTEFAGNAATSTLASNIAIGANRVPYNNANNSTTSSSNFTFNGTTLSVANVTSSFTGDLAGRSTASDTSKIISAGGGGYNVVLTDGLGNNKGLAIDGGITFNGGSNSLTVSGDITAFASDMRLKTNIEKIQGAVAKVCKLSGFTYEFNETGRDLKLPAGKQLGVSAQQVQEIFPEAVAVRPIDEYLTVKYEKLVPVLIEAIKELKEEIESLKSGGYGKA